MNQSPNAAVQPERTAYWRCLCSTFATRSAAAVGSGIAIQKVIGSALSDRRIDFPSSKRSTHAVSPGRTIPQMQAPRPEPTANMDRPSLNRGTDAAATAGTGRKSRLPVLEPIQLTVRCHWEATNRCEPAAGMWWLVLTLFCAPLSTVAVSYILREQRTLCL